MHFLPLAALARGDGVPAPAGMKGLPESLEICSDAASLAAPGKRVAPASGRGLNTSHFFDADAVFANAGVPSAMIFVRNEHGSHNPHEAMEIDDFVHGTNVLYHALLDPPL